MRKVLEVLEEYQVKGTIKSTADFSFGTMEVTRNWGAILEILNGEKKSSGSINSIPSKTSLQR